MNWIKIEKRENGICILTLDRPEAHNAFSVELLNEFIEVLNELKSNSQVRVLILTGAGEKAFSSGVDLKVLQNFTSIEDARNYALLLENASESIFNFPKPVVSAINGFALGGGMGFASATDYRVASDQSEMGFPAVKLGAILPMTCALYLTQIIGLSNARDILLTGRLVQAEEALKMNLVNKVVEHAKVLEESIKVAEMMLKGTDMALFYTKKTLNSILSRDIESQKVYAADNFAFLSQTREWQERINNFGKK